MRLIQESPEGYDALLIESRSTLANFLSLSGCVGVEDILPAGEKLFGEDFPLQSVVVVREGCLILSRGGKQIAVFDEGDAIVPWLHSGIPGVEIYGEFGTRISRFSETELSSMVRISRDLEQLWTTYLKFQTRMLMLVVVHLTQGEVDASPALKRYAADESIVVQGNPSPEVFTLLEGAADVVVDGVPVGEVLPDEIFGAIGALCDGPRIATVVARTECMVLSLPKERFVELLSLRPKTVVKLIEDLARVVTRLNAQLVEQSKKPDTSGYHKVM